MSFGFSVNDFVAAIELVIKIGSAMHDTMGSKRQYSDLLDQFRAFQYPLLFIKRYITKHPEEANENEAVVELTRAFQARIDLFLQRLEKYQGHLGPGLKISLKDKAKANVAKIQFTLFQSDDIKQWKQDLGNYAIALNNAIAIALIWQMSTLRSESRNYRNDHNQSSGAIATTLHRITAQVDMLVASSAVLETQRRSELKVHLETLWSIESSLNRVQSILSDRRQHDLQEYNAATSTPERVNQILQGERQTMQSIQELRMAMDLNVQRLLNARPQGDIPITFEDATGTVYRFYTDYVSSAEIFQKDLETRWMSVPGRQMVENQQYILTDAHTGEVIEVSDPVEKIFTPARVILMSMCFQNKSEERGVQFSLSLKTPQKLCIMHARCRFCGHLYRSYKSFLDHGDLSDFAPGSMGNFVSSTIRVNTHDGSIYGWLDEDFHDVD